MFLLIVIISNVTILSLPAAKGLAMDSMPKESYTPEDFREYLLNYSDEIDIQIIGDIDLSENVKVKYIDLEKVNGIIENIDQEDNYNSIGDNDFQEQKKLNVIEENTKTQIFTIENITKYNKICLNKAIQKTNKNQTLSVIVANNKMNDVISSNNIIDAKNMLKKGYSIIFETNNLKEIDEIYLAFGIIDIMELEYPDISDSELQPYCVYITQNMLGEYNAGIINSNGEHTKDAFIYNAF